GEKILDIGSGSGWTSALLAECVGEQGKVIGIEIVPEIFEFGKNNLRKYNFIEKGIVQFILGDGILGFAKEAPFDKILCSASLQEEVPKAWKEQLKIKGKIVVPLFHSIWLFEKIANDQFKESEFEGFVFVPFVKKK
ncbi:MAG: protein-L-isoaspartate O-methyltransferase family protein, partial [Minisyncoccales bacterium]